jgi:transcriptional regulator with XRE-family HTH domain
MNNNFTERLHILAREFGTRKALAKACGIPASTLQSYENGSQPGIDALLKIARATNADLTWLMTGEGKIRPEGLLPGSLFADLLLVDLFQMGTSLSLAQVLGQLPLSRAWLQTKLRIADPASADLLLIEANWTLGPIAQRDLVLINRRLNAPQEDGIYLLDLPGLALRGIVRGPANDFLVIGPSARVVSAKPAKGQRRPPFAERLQVSRQELLGDGRCKPSKTVGRAVWISRFL